jgi:2-dehydro-3-deoxy-D-gluconate 5-dehydrogenase
MGLVPIVRDLAVRGAAAEVIAECVSLFGGLDILVNSHGMEPDRRPKSLNPTTCQKTIEVNLVSVFDICQATAREFLRVGRGKIINVASMLSFSGGLHASAYAASKGGVAQLTKALANEWAGYFDTPMTEGLRADTARSRQILERLRA